MYDSLKAQIEKTTRNLERGEILLADRIFLNHILDELDFILNDTGLESRQIDAADSLFTMIGSVNELVEDGLED